ncbi:MAG: DNA-binding protein [Actinomycetota bacterium]|nr:DNA-binding protein [Actinomycetota bacterium]
MTEWTFRLTLRGIELTDEQVGTLYEAGCDDGSFSAEADGTVLGFFDRAAPTEQDAVISAILDVERSGIGARVLRVQADDDWLTASEIAERVGRSRQSVALLARGERGPGDFPAPVARRRSSNPLWRWSKVEAWFERYEPGALPAHGPRLSPDFLAEVNDRLDLRERLRHSPNAPWRPKLDEALPLGA